MTTENDMSTFAEAAERFFQETSDPIQRLGGDVDSSAIWAALEEMMFPAAWTREDHGGVGLSAAETGQIIEAAGRFAFDAGLIETIVARRWAGQAGLDLPEDRAVALAPTRLGDRIAIDDKGKMQGSLRDVSSDHETALVLAEGSAGPVLATIKLKDADLLSQRSGPRGAISTLRLDGLSATAFAASPVSDLMIRTSAAAFSAAWIAGALRGLLGMCVEYAGERVAFGRKISKFQAIQHNLARLATETASAEVAARSALLAIDAGSGVFEGASAKARADTAGREGCAIAHQFFGAIGFTIEHPLHLFTGQIGALRDLHGAGPEWAALIGQAALNQPGKALWPAVTDGPRFGQMMEDVSRA